MKYRKKPIVIEAIRWVPCEPVQQEMIKFFGGCLVRQYNDIIIDTLEGEMRASPGDYIIKGIKGEMYPCKPDIFEATYEKVDE